MFPFQAADFVVSIGGAEQSWELDRRMGDFLQLVAGRGWMSLGGLA